RQPTGRSGWSYALGISTAPSQPPHRDTSQIGAMDETTHELNEHHTVPPSGAAPWPSGHWPPPAGPPASAPRPRRRVGPVGVVAAAVLVGGLSGFGGAALWAAVDDDADAPSSLSARVLDPAPVEVP